MNEHSLSSGAQEVDFLPASYHERRAHRKTRVWRVTILGVAVLLSLLGSTQQYSRHRTLSATRDSLERQVLDSFSQLQGADAKRQRITALEAHANLVTQLRLCVPPTRLMSAVVDALPDYVSLTEFRVERNRVSATSTRSRREPHQPTDQAEHPLGAQRDLEQLVRERSQTALTVTLTGMAPDDLSVSEYLATLKHTNLFEDIQPLYTDESEYGELRLRAFSVRLTVRRPRLGISTDHETDARGPVAKAQTHVDAPRQASRLATRRGT